MSESDEFRAFMDRNGRTLHQAAYLMCGDWHAAQDLVQTTLTNAWAHWRRVQAADDADAYVHGMLINSVRSRWRRRPNRETPRSSVFPQQTVDDHAQSSVERDALVAALLTLPAGQRAVVVCRYLRGHTTQETASVLNVSVGTVKSQTSRALRALHRELAEESLT